MSTTDYFVLCETTTQDEKGRISLINIFDSISTENLPAMPGKICIAFSFEIDPSLVGKPLQLAIEIDAPDGKNLINATGKVTPPQETALPPSSGARIISALNINSPSFESYGEYKYRLKLDDIVLNENCLRVLPDGSIKEMQGKTQ